MKREISYNYHFIFGESFQRKNPEAGLPNIPLSAESLAVQERSSITPISIQCNFPDENEADEYAVRKTKERIDEN
jgi:hypothetical protein